METSGTSYKWKALATVALSTMMGAMDFTFVNLSLPMLTKIFKTDLATVVWLNLTFSVVLITLGPVLGKINDVIGRKRVFVAGSAFIAFGLVACSLSQTIGQLILFRVVYAIGNAMTSTCHAAIITDAFPQNERGKGLGLQNSSLSLGFIIGSVAGGILLNWLGWRSIFYVRVPVGLILFLMALTLLRKDKPGATNIRFDIAGTLTSAAGLLSLILGLSLIAKLGLQSPTVYTLIIAGLVFLALLVYAERKAEDATVDLSLFKNRTFSGAMVSLLFYWMAVQGLALTSPFYLMEGRSMAASYVGILFTVGTITSLLISPLSGSLSDRFGALSLSAIEAGLVLSPTRFGSASARKHRSSSLYQHSS